MAVVQVAGLDVRKPSLEEFEVVYAVTTPGRRAWCCLLVPDLNGTGASILTVWVHGLSKTW